MAGLETAINWIIQIFFDTSFNGSLLLTQLTVIVGSLIIITRKVKDWGVLMLPVVAGWHLTVLHINYIFFAVAMVLFVIGALSTEGIGEMLRLARSTVSGIFSGETVLNEIKGRNRFKRMNVKEELSKIKLQASTQEERLAADAAEARLGLQEKTLAIQERGVGLETNKLTYAERMEQKRQDAILFNQIGYNKRRDKENEAKIYNKYAKYGRRDKAREAWERKVKGDSLSYTNAERATKSFEQTVQGAGWRKIEEQNGQTIWRRPNGKIMIQRFATDKEGNIHSRVGEPKPEYQKKYAAKAVLKHQNRELSEMMSDKYKNKSKSGSYKGEKSWTPIKTNEKDIGRFRYYNLSSNEESRRKQQIRKESRIMGQLMSEGMIDNRRTKLPERWSLVPTLVRDTDKRYMSTKGRTGGMILTRKNERKKSLDWSNKNNYRDISKGESITAMQVKQNIPRITIKRFNPGTFMTAGKAKREMFRKTTLKPKIWFKKE